MLFHDFDGQTICGARNDSAAATMPRENEHRPHGALIRNGHPPRRDESTDSDNSQESAAIYRVLGIIERQLRAVNTDVEVSVDGVCSGFHGMAERAQAAIRNAEAVVGGGGNGSHSERDLICEMRTVLSALVSNIRSSSEFSQSISQRLHQLEKRLAAVATVIQNIETIAHKVKFIAFNTRIEAVRLGDKGNALSAVARETAQLASHAAESNDSIRDLVEILSNELKSTSAEIKSRSEFDAHRVIDSEYSANELLNDIAEHNERISSSLAKTGALTSELRTDIANAVINMQFQDRISQRISHVIETLQEIATRLRPPMSDSAIENASPPWLDAIMNRYTMESERMAHSSSDQLAQSSDPSGSSVELF